MVGFGDFYMVGHGIGYLHGNFDLIGYSLLYCVGYLLLYEYSVGLRYFHGVRFRYSYVHRDLDFVWHLLLDSDGVRLGHFIGNLFGDDNRPHVFLMMMIIATSFLRQTHPNGEQECTQL